MLQHWETDDIRLIDVRVVGYAKERTIHIGPDSIDPVSTIRAHQMRMEVMTKTKYLTQALPQVNHGAVWRKPGQDLGPRKDEKTMKI